jgi:DNA-binding response OmpR family regulator
MSKPKILIIDDEFVTQAMLEDILTAYGYEVIRASQGAAGIKMAVYEHPNLILLDIILPDRNGLTILAELRKNERTADIPVILMSALSDSKSFDNAGAAAFVHKPIAQEEILRVIERILSAR